jgi:hypothetical protein
LLRAGNSRLFRLAQRLRHTNQMKSTLDPGAVINRDQSPSVYQSLSIIALSSEKPLLAYRNFAKVTAYYTLRRRADLLVADLLEKLPAESGILVSVSL